ncbi:aspartic proteinase NANA, chloroplast-like [Olea europaea var. sylvestris]|uniref:aspartic proteinase NANA, chloroplast-like n=1 Tax=Olea europaea var. sylvestris TaxID=158386 RepID=UPI000C1CDDF6|nr:aspartic proteinase NANA, chloroplast-like [Olea europaea var. sylvestris]
MVTYGLPRGSFLFIFLFFVVIFLAKFSHGDEKPGGTKLEMIHINNVRRAKGMPPITRFEHLRQLLDRDIIRHQKNRNRRQARECRNAEQTCTNNVSGDMAMYSGADFGVGEYYVSLSVGSPAQKVVLIADTGSDLTWVKCNYWCNGTSCGENFRKQRVFRADQSSSFNTVPCSSEMCKNELIDLASLPGKCPSPGTPCAYEYRYLSGDPTNGIFSNETVTFAQTNGKEAKIDNMLVGCSKPSDFENFEGADGLLGLGYNNYSLALRAANKFGGKFSYCLVDHWSTLNVSSYLIFGSHESIESIKTLNRTQRTELVLRNSSGYGVNIKGISVGNKMLKIPDEVWDVKSGGGMTLDSGTSLTFLTKPAYDQVMAALMPSLKNFARLNLTGQPDFCFDSKGYNESMVPRLVIHFADGVQFEPSVENYVIDVADDQKCLGFVQTTWPDQSIIGNIMQQNHFWEFDLANSKLTFGSSSCT